VEIQVLGLAYDPRIFRGVDFLVQKRQEAIENLVVTYPEYSPDDFSDLAGFLGFLDTLGLFF